MHDDDLMHDETNDLDIAVVGMGCRFPGANNIHEFWENLERGVESVSFFSNEELARAGVRQSLIDDPNYVNAAGSIDGIDLFDASFFGFTPREAEMMDPQQRLFLECAWEAFETAGYNPEAFGGRIGVFAGTSTSMYLLRNIMSHYDLRTSDKIRQIWIGNDTNFFSTLLSYKFNLTGPSMTVQTACSTSLVAIHMACQSLLDYQSDMTIAGGCKITVPQKEGYLFREGEVMSPDGHCRPFDENAQGTISGSGVGLVVLKRLEDALNDGDNVMAVIKGSAINNDGINKIGYSAPSIEGQMKVISEAHIAGNIDPETISYVEAHGTGTPLGDPIEIEALTKAFRAETEKSGYCAIGSVKSNVGHLDSAAGVCSFIKTVLALQNKKIPASLNFENPNPRINFTDSPFYVNTELQEWTTDGETPRRAGVSSFGIGGTNAHLVLEEAPAPAETAAAGRDLRLVTLSARSGKSLREAAKKLQAHVKAIGDNELDDMIYTLNTGRKTFNHTYATVCRDRESLIAALDPDLVSSQMTINTGDDRKFVYLFPGQGSQYVGMGRDLYENQEIFKEFFDECCELFEKELSVDIREILFGDKDRLYRTLYTQAIIFSVEYALSKLLESWGIMPDTMIGHSLGEYSAACLAGVFSLEDVVSLIATRGKLLNSLEEGSMLSVSLTEDEARIYCNTDISLAAVNTPGHCVLSGKTDAIKALKETLDEKGVRCRFLHTSHAFHSAMLDPMLGQFREALGRISLSAPTTSYISGVTGDWITGDEVTTVEYWCRHLRDTVRFNDAVSRLDDMKNLVYLEVGPGNTLGTLVGMHTAREQTREILTTIPHPHDPTKSDEFLLTGVAKLWALGMQLDWNLYYEGESRTRRILPTYPFERQSYWIGEERQTCVDGETEATTDAAPVNKKRYQRPALLGPLEEPTNDFEEEIVAIWEELFGIEPIGISDNFFALGGHSLLAVQMISRIKEKYFVEIPMKEFLEKPTPRDVMIAIIEEVAQTMGEDEILNMTGEG